MAQLSYMVAQLFHYINMPNGYYFVLPNAPEYDRIAPTPS